MFPVLFYHFCLICCITYNYRSVPVINKICHHILGIIWFTISIIRCIIMVFKYGKYFLVSDMQDYITENQAAVVPSSDSNNIPMLTDAGFHIANGVPSIKSRNYQTQFAPPKSRFSIFVTQWCNPASGQYSLTLFWCPMCCVVLCCVVLCCVVLCCDFYTVYNTMK